MDPQEFIDTIRRHIFWHWPKYLAGFVVIVVIIGSVTIGLMS